MEYVIIQITLLNIELENKGPNAIIAERQQEWNWLLTNEIEQ